MESSLLISSTIESKTATAHLNSTNPPSSKAVSASLAQRPLSSSSSNSALNCNPKSSVDNSTNGTCNQAPGYSLSTITTTISFATPENSPFLTKRVTLNNCGVNMSTGATLDTAGDVDKSVTQTSSSKDSSSISTSGMISSVTPQDKSLHSVNFKQLENNLNSHDSPKDVTVTSSKVTPASTDRKYKASVTAEAVAACTVSTSTSVQGNSTVTENAVSTSNPSSSTSPGSPSLSVTRVPSLQPRKLPAEHSSTSTIGSDVSSIQPPSLCSSQNSSEGTENRLEGELHHPNTCKAEEDCSSNIGTDLQQSLTRTVSESLEHNANNSTSISNNITSANTAGELNHIKQEKEVQNEDQSTNRTNSDSCSNNNNRNTNNSPAPPPQSFAPNNMHRTPIRSHSNANNNRNQQQNVDFPSFGSPGIFLSPYLPSPPDSRRGGSSTGTGNAIHSSNNNNSKNGGTPTNFARDFGKTDFINSEAFDANNGML
jgi:hypothetical protein